MLDLGVLRGCPSIQGRYKLGVRGGWRRWMEGVLNLLREGVPPYTHPKV